MRTDDQLYPGDIRNGHNSRSAAEEALAEFEEGEQLPLYVDTTDPDHAFVYRETTPMRNAVTLGVGLTFAVVGIGILAVSLL